MYSFSKRLENVYSYQAKNNNLVYKSFHENTLYFNDNEIFKNIETFVFNGYYIIFSSTEKPTIYKLWLEDKNQVNVLFENHALGDKLHTDNEITIYGYEEGKRILYDFEKDKVIFIQPKPSWFNTEEYIFFTKSQEPILESFSLETGEYLWETNITIEGDTDPRLKQVLGISGDVLVVFTFGSTLVGIDVHTGEILWSILPKGFYPLGFTGMAWCWHLADGYLYLLRHQYYLRINLSNQQLEVLWQTLPDTLEFEDCSYTEEHIYFMAIDKKSNIFNTSILGVFDRKALKIVWQHDQPIYSSQPPQADGNKLYCLDTAGTLHIFVREKLNP
jgi:PQQ-like domain